MTYGHIGQLEGSWGVVVGLPQAPLAQLLFLPGQFEFFNHKITNFSRILALRTSQTGAVYILAVKSRPGCLSLQVGKLAA